MKQFNQLTTDEVIDFKNNFEFDQVLVTMLWAEADGDKPLDDNYDIDDVDEKCANGLCERYYNFISNPEVSDILQQDECVADEEQIAHDFWLTHEGHGVGFWDRPEVYGDGNHKRLSELIDEIFGEIRCLQPYVGDDNKVYISGLEG